MRRTQDTLKLIYERDARIAQLEAELAALRDGHIANILRAFEDARLHGQQKYGGDNPIEHDLQHLPGRGDRPE